MSIQRNKRKDVSIVVPCYNEQDILAELVRELRQVEASSEHTFEVILVNDGSTDLTSEVINQLAAEHLNIIAVDLMRNFGQTQAYQVGLDLAQGDYLIFFSGDLETPAANILDIIANLDAGYDLVNSARVRDSSNARDWKSRVANRILNKIFGLSINDRGSGLKGFRHELYKNFRLYGEWHRFIPDYASIYTDRIVEIEVPYSDRVAGASSYQGRIRSLAVFLDLPIVVFTVFSHRKPYIMLPGRLFGFTGLVLGSIGFVVSLVLVIARFGWGMPLADRPLFLVSIILAALGIMMAMMGILGELTMQLQNRLNSGSNSRIRALNTQLQRSKCEDD